jgi:hypothetical protein
MSLYTDILDQQFRPNKPARLVLGTALLLPFTSTAQSQSVPIDKTSNVPSNANASYGAAAALRATTTAPDSMPVLDSGASAAIALQEAKSAIVLRVEQLANDPDALDEDEPAPPPHVIHEVVNLVRDAYTLLDTPPPQPTISTFYGELNITWRSNDQIVRLASFPSRPSLVQFGGLLNTPKQYQVVSPATAEDLVMEP